MTSALRLEKPRCYSNHILDVAVGSLLALTLLQSRAQLDRRPLPFGKQLHPNSTLWLAQTITILTCVLAVVYVESSEYHNFS